MVVVTGIITVIKIIAKAIPIIYRGGKKIPPVVKYFDRHRKAATIITTAAGTAPLIYDLLNIDYDAIPFPKFPQAYKKRQTRNYLVKSFPERFRGKKHTTRCSCRFCRQRYRNRM